ncbi:hypothetical protein NDU88_001280 [Pleurodeles waltl]|uniref:Uncharacterized protein n=1 Tax=Pleurodeles waltl TaxID=8319 RepID=A0AAV7U5W7_PLEWA|nr:hypothetical protein NDU88_001280 [Pleurodeles waltl]
MGRLRPGRSRHTPGGTSTVLVPDLDAHRSGTYPRPLLGDMGLCKPFAPSPERGGGKRKKRQHRDHQRQSRRQRQYQDHQGHCRKQRHSMKQTPVLGRGVQRRWCLYPSKYQRARRQNSPGPATLWGERGLSSYMGVGIYLIFPMRRAGGGSRTGSSLTYSVSLGWERKRRD